MSQRLKTQGCNSNKMSNEPKKALLRDRQLPRGCYHFISRLAAAQQLLFYSFIFAKWRGRHPLYVNLLDPTDCLYFATTRLYLPSWKHLKPRCLTESTMQRKNQVAYYALLPKTFIFYFDIASSIPKSTGIRCRTTVSLHSTVKTIDPT